MKLRQTCSTFVILLVTFIINLKWRFEEPSDEWLGSVSEKWLTARTAGDHETEEAWRWRR